MAELTNGSVHVGEAVSDAGTSPSIDPATLPVLGIVYALHDFEAENPDELQFHAGEPIEVTEKDDQYGDGWWQGRNARGEHGLFPQSYTTSSPPAPPTNKHLLAAGSQHSPQGLDSLTEEGSDLSGAVDTRSGPQRKSTTPMHDTLSEVQLAIDQLGSTGQLSSSPDAKAPLGATSNGLATGSPQPRRRPTSSSSRSLSSASSAASLASSSEGALADRENRRSHQPRKKEDALTTRARLAEKAKAEMMARTASEKSREDEWRAEAAAAGPTRLEMSDESDDEHEHGQVGLGSPIKNLVDSKSNTPRQGPTDTFATSGSPRPDRTSGGYGIGVGAAAGAAAAGAAAAMSGMGKLMARSLGGPDAYQAADEKRDVSDADGGSEYQRSMEDDEEPAGGNPFAAAAAAFGVPPSSTSTASPKVEQAPASPKAKGPGLESPSALFKRQESKGSQMSFIVNRDWETDSPPVPKTDPISSAPAPVSSPPAAIVAPIAKRETSPSPPPISPTRARRASSGFKRQVPPGSAPTGATISSRASSLLPSSSTAVSTTPNTSHHPDEIVSPTSTLATEVPTSPTTGARAATGIGKNGLPEDPTTWTVEQVVEWGKQTKLDDFTLSKFTEHEITGDVLLELDLNTLKEIDLTAFGRRVRVNKAIQDLKKSVLPAAGPPGSGSGSDGVAGRPASSALASTPTSPTYGTAPNSTGPSSPYTSGLPAGAQHPEGGLSPAGPTLPMTPESPPAVGDQYSPAVAAALGMSSPTIRGSPQVASGHARQMSENATPLGLKAEELRGLGLSGSQAESGPVSHAMARPSMSHPSARQNSSHSVSSFRSAPDERVSEAGDDVSPILGAGAGAAVAAAAVSGHRRTDTVKSVRSTTSSTPSSPDASKAPGKTPRASFLGTLNRVRKPPPRVPAPSVTSSMNDDSNRASDLGASRSSTGSHRLSTRILPFAHGSFGHHGSKDAARPQPRPVISHPMSADEFAASREFPSRAKSSDGSGAPGQPPLKSSARSPSKLGGSHSGAAKRGSVDQQQDGPQKSAAEQIGIPDHSGWMRKKGENYPTWKMRYFVLKGTNLYYLKSETETKIKGHIRLAGYRVIMDGDVNPGRYGFKIAHDSQHSHSFSSEDSKVIREWMKAIMKAIIERDWQAPVVTTCSVDVIDISEAQKMFPPPRPPSPTSRARVQKLHLPERPDLLTPQDADKLMAMAPPPVTGKSASRPQGKSAARKAPRSTRQSVLLNQQSQPASPVLEITNQKSAGHNASVVPLSPKMSRNGSSSPPNGYAHLSGRDPELLEWVNAHLPPSCLPVEDLTTSMRSGKVPTRLVEHLSGVDSGLSDEEFATFDPANPIQHIETQFSVFDYLNARRVPLQDCSLNDLLKGNPGPTLSLIEAIRAEYS